MALFDFLVPEGLDGLNLTRLTVTQVWWHVIEEQRSAVLVTQGHVLLVVRVLKVLELQVHEGTRREVEDQGRFVRRIHKVPHVDSVRLRDEDYAWTRWREGTTRVVRSLCVH